jgi:hypothetical protein
MFKLIINDLTIEFATWDELQTYLYTLDQKKKRTKKKADGSVYRVITSEPFRIVFDE